MKSFLELGIALKDVAQLLDFNMSSSSFASGLTVGDGDDDDAGVEDTEVRNRLYKRIDCARVHMCFGIKALRKALSYNPAKSSSRIPDKLL